MKWDNKRKVPGWGKVAMPNGGQCDLQCKSRCGHHPGYGGFNTVIAIIIQLLAPKRKNITGFLVPSTRVHCRVWKAATEGSRGAQDIEAWPEPTVGSWANDLTSRDPQLLQLYNGDNNICPQTCWKEQTRHMGKCPRHAVGPLSCVPGLASIWVLLSRDFFFPWLQGLGAQWGSCDDKQNFF